MEGGREGGRGRIEMTGGRQEGREREREGERTEAWGKGERGEVGVEKRETTGGR